MAEKINTITAAEFNAKGISSLADRPNQTSTYGTGGLSAQELKARFDALSITLKDKLNEIINVLASPQATKYIGLDGSLNGKDNLYALLSTIPTGEFSEVLKTEYLSDDGKTETIPLNTVIAMLQMSDSDFAERITSLENGGGGSSGGASITVDSSLSTTSTNPVQNRPVALAINELQMANSQLNNKIDSLPTTDGKNYIDIAEYVENGVVNSTAFNAKLSELASQSKGGNDRVDIYFYMSRGIVFDFDNRIVWQSNCNYHYISYERSQPIQSSIISLNNISNCQFKGFSISGMPELDNYSLSLSGCTNIEFYDCTFTNYYETAVYISNCKSIYFNDCYIYGGTFPPPGSFDNQYQHECVVINDTSGTQNWIIFENCEIQQGISLASSPLFDCSGVTNTRAALFVLHCITNDNEDVAAINFSKGSGKIRISALTSV